MDFLIYSSLFFCHLAMAKFLHHALSKSKMPIFQIHSDISGSTLTKKTRYLQAVIAPIY